MTSFEITDHWLAPLIASRISGSILVVGAGDLAVVALQHLQGATKLLCAASPLEQIGPTIPTSCEADIRAVLHVQDLDTLADDIAKQSFEMLVIDQSVMDHVTTTSVAHYAGMVPITGQIVIPRSLCDPDAAYGLAVAAEMPGDYILATRISERPRRRGGRQQRRRT